MAKSGANYMYSQLIKMEAIRHGYAEGIALDRNGYVSEGSAQNFFIWYNGRLVTPPLATSVLPGITRDTIMTLARDAGFEVAEQNIPRGIVCLAEDKHEWLTIVPAYKGATV